ncbi:glycosyl hydrolase family 28-related protein [Priestia megaterium]|uniref:glycosyl hydrolase family 28-related protein n=1 Tax=Priestia megaterium TaxID=1404 RepID=UPI00112B8D70|nr:glycosyl hydrolase family 28-related protein [Priestia megaterium]TPF17911.1 hypothetical protein CBE78_01435 [Priestia megaterium]TPF22019.1 hypothetical protein CBE79_03940 [Priestia megaterium]
MSNIFAQALGQQANKSVGSLASLQTTAKDSVVSALNESVGKINILKKNAISVLDFGAKGDGVTDDSDAIQAAIDYCVNLIKTKGGFAQHCVIQFPSGVYKTTKTVTSKPYVKLISSGFVVLQYAGTGTALQIKCDSSEPAFYKEMWSRGTMLSGNTGSFVIQGTQGKPAGSVGLDLGNLASNEKDFARYTIDHIGITGFETGLLLRNVQHYLGVFDNVHLEGNKWNIRTFYSGTNTVNSGENFRFNNCVFAISEIVLKHETDSFDFVFSKCSFDFVGTVVEFNKGYASVRFDNCYYEAISSTLINSLSTSTSVAGSIGNTVYFNKCILYSDIRRYIKGKYLSVFVDGLECRYMITDGKDASRLTFAENDATNTFKVRDIFFSRVYAQCFTEKLNINRYGDFETSAVGDDLLAGTVAGYKLLTKNAITSAAVSSDTAYTGTNSLKIVGTTGNYIDFELKDKIKAEAFDHVYLGFRMALNTTNSTNMVTRIDAYDAAGVKIGSSNNYQPSKAADSSLTWGYSEHVKNYILPAGTDSFNIYIMVSNFNGTVYLDNITLHKF